MIRGANLGDNKVHVSHLQFTNDIILFLEARVDYLSNVRRILRFFELASSLCINFHKSCLVRVAKRRATETDYWANIFKCNRVSLPIMYQGFPLGAWPCLVAF